jgi:ribose 1,5-bisphosphokinase PhnN
MEPAEEDYQVLVEWLTERGHSEDEIQTILARVRDYDEKTQHDSVMDSIGSGRISLDALVKDALGQ